MSYRILLPLALLVPALVPAGGPSQDADEPVAIQVLDLSELEKGLPKGWELKSNEGKVQVLEPSAEAGEKGSWVQVGGPDDGRHLGLHCKKASFSVNRDLSELELDGHPLLEWEWRATDLPDEGDMRNSERNDQALQILVQLDTSAKRVISYVWDTTAPVGTQDSESYAMGLYKVKVLCVQSGSEGLGEWHTLRRDLRADYKLLYGSDDFPGVAGIRIQSNSQYTKSLAAGEVRSLSFLAPEEQQAQR